MKLNRSTLRIFYVVIFLSIIMSFVSYNAFSAQEEMSYNQFVKNLNEDKYNAIKVEPSNGAFQVTGEFKTADENGNTTFKVYILPTEKSLNDIATVAEKNDVKMTIAPASEISFFGILSTFIPLLLMGFIILYFFKTMGNSNSKAMSFGENKARLNSVVGKSFDNIAGYVEEKQELIEVVEFLKNPAIFKEMGAKIPKGVLLVGPPGTGKTLLAQAVAGEANVPFYSISGSDFVEMFVGVGASRVREMFKQAKKASPCIVFIDEIDAVGRKRGNGVGGGNDEREQTLNQLLVEMDGFEVNSGIVVIAATNRADVLDNALLRPGRFDRQVQVGMPDLKTREEILRLHAKNVKILEGVDFAELAKNTSGMSGAELANIINESAIVAVRSKKKSIDEEDLEEALDRVILGPAKKTRKYIVQEKRIVSYHEVGHVIIGLDLEDASTIQKVTIVPRGFAGGYASMAPTEERFFQTKSHLLQSITGLLGGRASEEIFLKEISSGAHNDFERATAIARAMVTEYGMTDLGIYQYDSRENKNNPYIQMYSEETSKKIDEKINEILDTCYEQAKEILNRRREDVELLAEFLREEETLTRTDIDYILEHKKMPEKAHSEVYTTEELLAIEREQLLVNYKQIQKQQVIARRDVPETHILTDDEINELINKDLEKIKKERYSVDASEQTETASVLEENKDLEQIDEVRYSADSSEKTETVTALEDRDIKILDDDSTETDEKDETK